MRDDMSRRVLIKLRRGRKRGRGAGKGKHKDAPLANMTAFPIV